MLRAVGTRVVTLALAALLSTIPLAGHAADAFEINAFLPVTGAAAFLGKAEATALSLIEDQVNRSGGIGGRPIKFAISDDQSNPQVAVQLLNGLIAKKVPVVIGPSLVAMCNAMVPLVTDGPIVYCVSPGLHPADGSYAFSAQASTTDLLLASATFFRQRGWRKIAIITSSDATGQDAEHGIDGAFTAQRGFQIIDREHFNTSDVSVAAQMAHIKASGAQALIAWSTGTPIATILRSLVDAGIDMPVETTNGNLTYAQMKAYAGFMPKELYFPAASAFAPDQLPNGPVKRAVTEFVNAFKPTGTRPDSGGVAIWDAALLVVDAYQKLGVGATAAQIKDYLAGLRGWSGINGQYDFRAIPQRGVGASSVLLIRWDPAKDTWIGVSKPGGEPLK
jgi:branched-chain amino acid transport system substrate-binding protein